MALEIGINEGWVLGPGSMLSEKGEAYNLHFVKGKIMDDILEIMEDESINEEHKMLIFTPKPVDTKGKLRPYRDVANDLKAEYLKLRVLFGLYFTKAELQKMFPPSLVFEGYTVTKENQESLMGDPQIVLKMFLNIVKHGIDFINTNKVWDRIPFRLKCLRQSNDKAFPRLTYKPEYDDWVELITVTPELAKVKFTKYEESKGWDSAAPPKADAKKKPTGKDAFSEEVPDAIPSEIAKDDLDF